VNEPTGGALVLGLGNPLMGDDGVGVEALQFLEERYIVPPAVDLVDGGTMGLYLLDRVAGYERLLVVDSVAASQSPGTVLHLRGDEVQAVFGACLSPHQAGVSDLLAALTLLERRPKEVVAIGMVPACLNVGLGLSGPVRANLERLVKALVIQLEGWGYPITLRVPTGACSPLSARQD